MCVVNNEFNVDILMMFFFVIRILSSNCVNFFFNLFCCFVCICFCFIFIFLMCIVCVMLLLFVFDVFVFVLLYFVFVVARFR